MPQAVLPPRSLGVAQNNGRTLLTAPARQGAWTRRYGVSAHLDARPYLTSITFRPPLPREVASEPAIRVTSEPPEILLFWDTYPSRRLQLRRTVIGVRNIWSCHILTAGQA